jgi:hypothetical protein
MARTIYDLTKRTEHVLNRDLIACDPSGLHTSAIPVRAAQGRLLFGSFLTEDGDRALVPNQVEGLLATSINSDAQPEDGAAVVYTHGRFIWSAVRAANPGFVFDPVAINTLKAKGITFEPAWSNTHWIGRP